MSEETESVLVKLTRMEGKLDLSNLRHDQTDAWKVTVDGRLNTHGERIGGLEQREIGREGERKGIATSTKIMWAVLTLILSGVGAALIRLMGGMA